MTIHDLKYAISQLKAYIELPNRGGEGLLGSDTNDVQIDDLDHEVSKIISTTTQGCKSISIILKQFDDLKLKADSGAVEKLNKLLAIYTDADPAKPSMSSIIGQDSNISIIQTGSVRILPTGHLTDAATLLLNSIPSIELARCVPYLSVEVITSRPPTSADGKAQGISLPRFLFGAFQTETDSVDEKLLLGLRSVEGEGDEERSYTTSGMELFTSPQTLIDPFINNDYNRAAAVIDRFRPFMSIDKLEVSVDPQVGFFSYRTATLDITLHDRSRLNEIADFIKPDLYGQTELLIEYGWSHPDTTKNNVYGLLLNSARMTEKYGVRNSSFTFTRVGEVKIKLKLFTKGYTDAQLITIGESSAEIKNARRAVEHLQSVIVAVKARVLKQDTTKASKEIRGEQQLFSQVEDIGAQFVLPKETADALQKFITKAKNATGDLRELSDGLQKLYGSDGKGGEELKVLKQQTENSIKKKLREIRKDVTKDEDPFLFSSHKNLNDAFTDDKDLKKTLDFKLGEYISFGRLIALFVGAPLDTSGAYNETQLIFYPFNSKAAAARSLSVAEFPIRTSELISGLTALGNERGLSLSLKEFISYVSNNFIDDMTSPAYGLGKIYVAEIDSVTGIRKPPKGVTYEVKKAPPAPKAASVGPPAPKAASVGPPAPKAPAKRQVKQKLVEPTDEVIFDRVQERLKKLGVGDGVFKMPQVDVLIETLPPIAVSDNETVDTLKGRTIVKFHFFDQCSSSYESIGALLAATRDTAQTDVGLVEIKEGGDPNFHIATYNNLLDLAFKAGVFIPEAPNAPTRPTTFNVTYDYDSLKAFIKRNVPYITYGSSATGVIDASFATIQDPRLSSIHMIRAGSSLPQKPSGLTEANLPLRTLPAQVSMTTIGCPFVQYMQQFFIDFGTNTTVDNIYGVLKLTHEISRGKFESKFDLRPLDAYGRYESIATQLKVTLDKLVVAADEVESG